jgi:prevent-host-death family protein
MEKTVNIHEAKTHLSKLLKRVMSGERIIIAKAGKPITVLTPIGEVPSNRRVLREHRNGRTLCSLRTLGRRLE